MNKHLRGLSLSLFLASAAGAAEKPQINVEEFKLGNGMMFQGTRTIGTTNIEADLKLIEEQERLREGMREELKLMRERLRRGEIDDLMKPENKTPRYRELEKRFDALV